MKGTRNGLAFGLCFLLRHLPILKVVAEPIKRTFNIFLGLRRRILEFRGKKKSRYLSELLVFELGSRKTSFNRKCEMEVDLALRNTEAQLLIVSV